MPRDMLKNLANVVTFQAGWFTCVLGAATDHGWAGPLAYIIYLASHLWHLPDPARYLRFCTVVGFLGLAIDSTLGAVGIITFHASPLPGWVCPPWLTALWMMFAGTLPLSLNWLTERPRLAALLGALGGPASYYAGASLGAIDLYNPSVTSLLILAVVWGILMPALLRLKNRMGLQTLPAS
ncbi:MAG: DUF2878 domain-containing protein [Nitrospira sp.]